MAEKQDYSQTELFSADDSGGQYKPYVPKNNFFLRIRGYEKVMLLVMGFALTSIIAFSLGVEKGRRSGLAENNISNTSGSRGFTIQVATFKNKQLALREVQLLLKEGLTPMAFAKGGNIVLCVGKFSNQESAQPLLIQLQRTYAGCRIRRL
jgi:hypothetical protein